MDNYYTLEANLHPARPQFQNDVIATVFSDDPSLVSLEARDSFASIRAVLVIDEVISALCALRRGVDPDGGLRLVA